MEKEINFLVPKHSKLTSKEVEDLLKKHSLTDVSKLPKIKVKDSALSTLEDVSVGDVIEIVRHSFAGENKYYRVVVE